MLWTPPERPAELTETRLIEAILDGHFPPGSNLPAERDLATQLGITRPTLREVLQRLARDGWLEIRHGKPTRVRNFWEEGTLAVLVAYGLHTDHPPREFVLNLLDSRSLLAPTYARLAIENDAEAVAAFLKDHPVEQDTAQEFTVYDWQLHRLLTILSGNPVFTLFINSVQRLYLELGARYFTDLEMRRHSSSFYSHLLDLAQRHESATACPLTEQIMRESRELCLKLYGDSGQATAG